MFSHLHLHTQYSLLEGAIRVKKLVKVLQERGFESCAITDHGNMYGAVEFHHALRGAGLKPILGLGAWVVEGRLDEHQDSPKVQSCALNLLCENREGYQSLTYLSSLGFTQGKLKGVPHLDHSLLEQHAQGLIAFSGSIESEIGQRLLNGRQEEARCLAKWYQELYAGGFFLEVQNTGRPEQPSLNAQVVALAQELGIPLLGTNDCFYLDPDEAEAQYILWLMGQQRRVTDSDVPPQFPPERFLRTEEQMREALAGLPEEALTNTQAIAERCEVDLFNKQYFLPNFEIPQQYTLDSWLEKEAQEGLEKRLSLLYELYHPTDSFEEFRQPYDARLKFELEIIISMKFPGYFLIVADFINWAKNHGVSVGPGRGSGAGSLVAYSLRITDVDPLRYGLLFERFLNPDRISMPDFDIDFDVEGRDSVIEYVRQHYGEQNVCQIATFGSLKAKAVVRGVARVLDFPYSEADKIAKLVPNELNIALDDALKKEPELARMAREGTENEQRLIDLSLKLENLNTHLGTHAAGVIIMDQDIREVMPVCTGREGELQSQYTMKWAEDQGAVKFDFLGLLNLSNIDQTLDLLNAERPESQRLDLDRISMDDPLAFELLCKADTTGVFQVESSGMKRLLADMRPSCFEDIVAILALYRPGPLGSGMVDDFVQCKHGRKKVVYPHPLMEPILKETYGVMVYQEQIMQGVQVLAGFTLGQADLLRRAIGKKIVEVLAEQRAKFVDGCLANPEFVEKCPANTTPQEKANEIFDLIDYFSGYGFNKSHTVAYGLISYQTAYLKAHYPVEFMAALLNGAMGSPEKVVNFIGECKEMSIPVLPPDVNHSGKAFTVSPLGYKVTRRTLTHFDRDWSGLEDAVRETWKRALQILREREFEQADEFFRELRRQGSETLPDGLTEWLGREARGLAVRFGLNAVKNVGGHAVDAILEVREKGALTDFMEFLKTVDLGRLNKRMLETLVKCGAFDSLHTNRAQLFAVLDTAMHLAQEFQRDQDENQVSLFELMDESDARATETRLEFPELRDWSTEERLKQEKEALGFYVSGHPLDRYLAEARQLATTTAELLDGTFSDEHASLVGIVVDKTVRLNKDSEKFAIVRVEDLRGTLEFPVYARTYSDCAELLESDEPLLIHGRVVQRDDEVTLIPDRIQRLSDVRMNEAERLTLELYPDSLSDEQLRLLRNILKKYPGEKPLDFLVHAEDGVEVTVSVEENLRFAPALTLELEELLPSRQIWFRYPPRTKNGSASGRRYAHAA